MTKHRYHPYAPSGGFSRPVHRPLRGVRQHRARFHGQVISHSAHMDTDGGGEAKRHKAHEAHLIPGVDGHRIFGFPNSIITKLRYGHYATITGTTGARGVNVFAANGLYDPDITGVGHQPLYYDQYSAIYDQYTVIGSKITVTYLPRTAALCTIVGIVGDDDSTVSATVETLMEQNNGVSSGMGPPGSPLVTLSQTFEPLMAFGVDTKDDGSSATTTGANPTELWTFGVWAAAADAGSTVVLDIKVEIEYTVKFSELRTPTQS